MFAFVLQNKHIAFNIFKDFVNHVLLKLIRISKYEWQADPDSIRASVQKVTLAFSLMINILVTLKQAGADPEPAFGYAKEQISAIHQEYQLITLNKEQNISDEYSNLDIRDIKQF